MKTRIELPFIRLIKVIKKGIHYGENKKSMQGIDSSELRTVPIK